MECGRICGKTSQKAEWRDVRAGNGGEVDKSLLIRSWLLRQRERFEGSAGVVIIILQHLNVDAGMEDRGCWNVLQLVFARYKRDGDLKNSRCYSHNLL